MASSPAVKVVNAGEEPVAHFIADESSSFNQVSNADPSILGADASMPIAIVGMGFRGPAEATNVEKLWGMILAGREGWSPIPATRWNNVAFHHPDHARHGTINVEAGHFLDEDVSLFDAPFFNMTSDEAAAMDPQQRLLLEVTYEAFENAGIPLPQIMGTNTACFVGSFSADYTDLLLRDPECVPIYQCTNAGHSRAMTANRVSYFFDLKGPSVTVDTACSGSLVALHLACQSLRTGDASAAIAAGVNLILSHEFMSTMSMMKFLSPDGRCYAFDEKANGYARGEAIGCLVLKPLASALRDKNTIRAVIRGTGSNQDGRTPGITLPSGTAQETLIRDVYNRAGLCPSKTEFVEAHGTGTQAGDPIETGAISRIFVPGRPPDEILRIGSIKTNVGHLEGASGVAGVIKAVLMLENRTFLPNRNFDKVNPRISLDDWKLKVQLLPEPWGTAKPHRVSINSFGYGGSNAHAIVEDALGYLSSRGLKGLFQSPSDVQSETQATPLQGNPSPNDEIRSSSLSKSRIFLVSAFDKLSCRDQMSKLYDYLLDRRHMATDEFLDDLAFTLNECRSRFTWKAAVTGSSAGSVISALSGSVKFRNAIRTPTLGFVFTGQGAQWAGMGQELLQTYPIFYESISRIDNYLAGIGSPFTVSEEISKPPEDSELSHPLLSQAVCTALQIALVDLLASWGICPDSVTGHSSGEIAAAYAVGALSMEDAMAVAYYRGESASQIPTDRYLRGAMMAVGMSAMEMQPYLNGLTSGKVVVACINSPVSVTVSGDIAGIHELEQLLCDKPVFSRRLAVDVAYHSHHMELVAKHYLESIANVKPRSQPQIPGHCARIRSPSFFSSVGGKEIQLKELGPQYWISNLLGQVRFAESLTALCFETTGQRTGLGNLVAKRTKRSGVAKKASVDCLLEVGPHSALAGPIKQTLEADTKLKTAEIVYCSVLSRKNHAVTSAFNAIATLASLNYPLDFGVINRLREDCGGREPQLLVDLPPYSWNHTRSYWAEPRLSRTFRNRPYPRKDLLGAPDNMACPFEPRWRNYLRLSELPWLADHKIQSNIVFPAAGYIAMAIEAALQLVKDAKHVSGFILRAISLKSALVMSETSAVEIMVSLQDPGQNLRDDFDSAHRFHIYSITEDNRWTEHCTGVVGVQAGREAGSGLACEIQVDDTDGFAIVHPRPGDSEIFAVNIEDLYERLRNAGLEYGPWFANLKEANASNDGACFAEITIPDTGAAMPMAFQHSLFIHPCTLDSIFHTIFAALSNDMGLQHGPVVPVMIDEMRVSIGLNSAAGTTMNICTRVRPGPQRDVLASIVVVDRGDSDSSSNPSLLISGLRCRRLEQESNAQLENTTIPIAYSIEWKPDPGFVSGDVALKLCRQSQDMPRADSDLSEALDECAAHFIKNVIDLVSEQQFDKLDTTRRRCWHHLRDISQNYDAMRQKQGKGNRQARVDIENPVSLGPMGEMLCIAGKNLSTAFRAKNEPCDTIDIPRLWDTYCDTYACGIAQDAAACYLDLVGHKFPDVSILEISTATCQTSEVFLRHLLGGNQVPRCKDYTFTHQNESAVHQAMEELTDLGPWIRCKQLKIGDDLLEQGFEYHRYDVILVLQGLHAVPSVRQALSAIHNLLRPSGYLIMIDLLQKRHRMVNALTVFAMHKWHVEDSDDAIEFPWDEHKWSRVLHDANFESISVTDHYDGGTLIISRAPNDSIPDQQKSLLIICEEGDCVVDVENLQSRLKNLALRVTTTDITNTHAEGRFCVVLSDLQKQLLVHPDERLFDKLKDIFLRSAGVLWVARGGTPGPTDPQTGLVTGFTRTARSESGVSPIMTLDLDGRNVVSGIHAAEVISQFIARRLLRADHLDDDMEYAERDGKIMIPRIIENTKVNHTLATINDSKVVCEKLFRQRDQPLRAPGAVANDSQASYFVNDNAISQVPVGYVGVEVQAFGLSERDIQESQDKYGSDSTPGMECSGTVYAVGAGVHGLSIGDRVACLGMGTARSFYHDRASAFQKMEDEMSFEIAAALPLAYTTAYYVVHYLSRIESNDAVLIHHAASWYGQAIVEMCCLRGARIFATVASPAQKELLSSRFCIPPRHIIERTDDFAEGFLKLIRRNKLNVVISCGDTDDQDVRLSWKYIAPFGQFIQLRGQNVHQKNQWSVPSCQENISFSTFNIFELRKDRGDLADQIWSKVFCLFRGGRLRGPSSTVTYNVTNFDDALAATPVEEHVVVTVGPGDTVKTFQPRVSNALFRADASYLLVGGLGGIGRATALWMAERGAKRLIFVSRSGLSKRSSQETARELEQRGVQVTVQACDISNEVDTRQMLLDASRRAPRIRGVIQAAMVLKDVHIEKMSVEDYHDVLRPKYAGTWNLHRHLPDGLDFFVMLSSISGVIGNATQAAYAAGSAFMDSFAAYRNSLGLPAVSLDLGTITDVGYLSENKELAVRMEKQGFQGTDTPTLMSLIETAISQPRTAEAVSQIVTGLGEWREGESLGNFDTPLFSHFRRRFQVYTMHASADTSAEMMREGLRTAQTLDEATAIICEALTAKIAAHLAVAVGSINPSNTISEYGVDSHVAVELRNWISKTMESTVSILEILASGSVLDLAGKIASKSLLVDVSVEAP